MTDYKVGTIFLITDPGKKGIKMEMVIVKILKTQVNVALKVTLPAESTGYRAEWDYPVNPKRLRVEYDNNKTEYGIDMPANLQSHVPGMNVKVVKAEFVFGT